MAPLVAGRKGEHQKLFEQLKKDGFIRVRVNGDIRGLEEEIVLDKRKSTTSRLWVDRLVVKEGVARRLTDSVELALRTSEGQVLADVLDQEELFFSERFACDQCGISYPELSPQLFSFNSPIGACPECDGLGAKMYFDPDLIVPNPELSLREGAAAPWSRSSSVYYIQMLEALAEHYDFDIFAPYKSLPDKVKKVILNGSGKEDVRFFFEKGDRRHFYTRPFEGIINNLERRYRETDSQGVREEIEKYMNNRACPKCNGARLRPEALSVKVGGLTIKEVTGLSVAKARTFFHELSLSDRDMEIARRGGQGDHRAPGFPGRRGPGVSVPGIATRPRFPAGRGQRIRLATQIGSRLVGVIYILDEPSIGLHQRDNARLLATLIKDEGSGKLGSGGGARRGHHPGR